MIIVGVVGKGVERHQSILRRLKDMPFVTTEFREVGRWLNNPDLSKARYYRDQIKALKQDGFNGMVVFTDVRFHDEFTVLAAHGGVMWHLVSGISDCIPIRLDVDVLVALKETQDRPTYIDVEDAYKKTFDRVIER